VSGHLESEPAGHLEGRAGGHLEGGAGGGGSGGGDAAGSPGRLPGQPGPVHQGQGVYACNDARPNVVALGGGHGLAVTLAAVSRYAAQVTAVVSVADDGGSSGRLRAFWPGPAPGDVRRCLLALAGNKADEALWAQVFDYRFDAGELAGHSLGNLVLVALSELTGDFVSAAAAMGRLLGVRAAVLPATTGPVDLLAETTGPGGPVVVEGQARVTRSVGPVSRVWLRPESPAVPAQVLDALAAADQVVLGPGSLFTSVLAVCAVPAIRRALAERSSGRVYVCNLVAGEGEAAGFDARAHLEALAAHGVPVDAAVFDPGSEVGSLRGGQTSVSGLQVVEAALSGPGGRSHDPAALARALEALVKAPARASGGAVGVR